mgnify:CR=1 FL=1
MDTVGRLRGAPACMSGLVLLAQTTLQVHTYPQLNDRIQEATRTIRSQIGDRTCLYLLYRLNFLLYPVLAF